jgi:hypothetical protein
MNKIAELVREKLLEATGNFKKGQEVKLKVRTSDPSYEVGDMLVIVNPNFDKLLGKQLILCSGSNGEIAVTEDMIQ